MSPIMSCLYHRELRAALAAAAIGLAAGAAGGCGGSAQAPAAASPPGPSRADVVISYDGKRHRCIVALRTEKQGSIVPCGEVAAFVRDELRLAKGSTYEIAAGADEPELGGLGVGLDGAGYRLIGRPRASP